MSFTKRTIKDRIATGDNKFSNSGNASNLVLTPTPDSVTEAGTSINADLLQRYEDALYALGVNIDGGNSSSTDANNDADTMGTRITIRRDTSTNWSNNNPVLASGEIGFDTTAKKIKVGDGTTAWNGLGFIAKMSDLPTKLSDLINDLVNNGTLTIQKNGSNVATFTANQSGSVTANITVPTAVGDLSNDRFIRYDTPAQGLSDTRRTNARTNIDAQKQLYRHHIVVARTGGHITFTIINTVSGAYSNMANIASYLNSKSLTSTDRMLEASGAYASNNYFGTYQGVYSPQNNVVYARRVYLDLSAQPAGQYEDYESITNNTFTDTVEAL